MGCHTHSPKPTGQKWLGLGRRRLGRFDYKSNPLKENTTAFISQMTSVEYCSYIRNGLLKRQSESGNLGQLYTLPSYTKERSTWRLRH